MRNTEICLFIVIVAVALSVAAPVDYKDIQVTRWVDPQGRVPMRYQEYMQSHPIEPVRVRRLGYFQPMTDTEIPMVVIVEETLYPGISGALNTYVADLTADDFDVLLIEWGGGTPEELKDSLYAWWEADSIAGAVLVGDLPVPWFELYEDFNDDSIPDNPYMVDFPCDLFYMDMDGNWEDDDGDGIYDVHDGDTDAEIWVGQLRAAELSQSGIVSFSNYFAKNHAYREETLIQRTLALNYIDDDWQGSAYSWGSALSEAIGRVITVNDINQTTAQGYLDRLDSGYVFIQVATHSSPFVHSFRQNNGSNWGYVYNFQIQYGDPSAFFYNLFACSNCRYVEDDYMGGWYVFSDSYGLGVVGSTKTGAMLYFEDYYPVLGNDGTFGEALMYWMNLNGNIPGHQMWSRSWFYGMTHLGDPTLRVPLALRYVGHSIDDDSSGVSRGDNDGIFDAGEKIELSVEVENPMSTACENVTLVLNSSDAYLDFFTNIGAVPYIPVEGSAIFEGYVVRAMPQTPDNHVATINMTLMDNAGHTWYDVFDLPISAPVPECMEYVVSEIQGNGNGWVDPGETVELDLLVHNAGGETVRNMTAEMELLSGSAVIQTNQVSYQNLAPDSNCYADSPFQIAVESTHPEQDALILRLKFKVDTCEINQGVVALPMSVGYEGLFSFESEDPAVRHYAVTDSYQDAWHWSTQYAYNGAGSEKFGDTEEGDYPAMADGALEFPLFPIGEASTLTFFHKMDAEIGYDGGIVEVNTGDGWTLVQPVGGYPYSAGNNGSFPAYTPCFSGEHDWMLVTVNLPYAAGFTKVRFRFGSDGGVEGLGWFLDDVTIQSSMVAVDDGSVTSAVPDDFSLLPAYPNPFNSTVRINFTIPSGNQMSELAVFNILGQQVITLWQGQTAGNFSTFWSGMDFQGLPVSSGLYFINLKYGQQSHIQKVILLR